MAWPSSAPALAALLLAAPAAGHGPWAGWRLEEGGWRDTEGGLWSNASVLGLREALVELNSRKQQPQQQQQHEAFDEATKLPAFVDPNQTLNGEGYFAVVGDFGNPFSPGVAGQDGLGQYWGPHYKCSTGGISGDRCVRGTPGFVRDDFSQINVSEQMTKFAQKHRLQFVVNVGDSLYPQSFESPTDPAWNKVFESRYPDKSLQIPWLSVLGNHDWGGFNCFMDASGRLTRADSQTGYDSEHDWAWPANKKSRWVLPAPIYKKSINFGDTTIDLFAIDTNWARVEEPCGEQPFSVNHCDTGKCHAFLKGLATKGWESLQKGLAESKAMWKFVFGHHPLFNLGPWHSPQKNIFGLLAKNNVSAYMCGHEHSQVLRWYTQKTGGKAGYDNGEQRPGAVMEIQSGGAGGAISDNPGYKGENPYGFVAVKVMPNELSVTYVSDKGEYQDSLVVPPPCAQFHNSTCAWGVPSQWGACEGGKKTRRVECSRGKDEYCENSEKPALEDSCGGGGGGGGGHLGMVIAIVVLVCVAAAGAAAAFFWHRRRAGARQPPLLEVIER